ACSALSFFLSLRPPPLPTLFPYTTLFRSLIQQHAPHLEVDGEMHGDCALDQDTRRQILPDNLLEGSANLLVCPDLDSGNIAYNRSEEHTSELQSRFDLVCRLLLEKKKRSD